MKIEIKIDWLINCWLTDWLMDKWMGGRMEELTDWLIDRPMHRRTDWLFTEW